MKKGVILIAVLLLSAISSFSSIVSSEKEQPPITFDVDILYVDAENYGSIQEAINAAISGDTVHVCPGIYYENIIINKTIDLLGGEKNTTILDGEMEGTTITITADNVTIAGFIIKNSGYSFPDAGINISSSYNTISGNNITSNFYGITMYYACNNVIIGNNITNNEHCGIYMSESSNNVILNNSLGGHLYSGIGLYDRSNNNVIVGNDITNNDFCGINIRESSNNNITGNTITDNNIGIHIPTSRYSNHISGNILRDNSNNIEKEFELTIEMLAIVCTAVCGISLLLFWIWRRRRKNT